MSRSAAARRVAAAVVAVASLLLVAGCARIPTTGQVTQGQPIDVASDQAISFFPDPPRPGMSKQEIIEGFLEAGTGTQDNYDVARQYLDDGLRQTWDPNAGIIVADAAPEIVETGDAGIRASYRISAKVDGDGQYSELAAGTAEGLDFLLAQDEAGEWRIVQAPNGIALLEQNFRSLFKSYTLYYYDATMTYLVPDVRWFDSQPSALTRIARALAKGPAPWLAEGSVISAIPPDVTLTEPVVIEGEVADVSLSSNLSSASPDRYSRMLLQLTESFKAFDDIGEVTMSIVGRPLEVVLPPEGEVVVNAQVTSTPFVYRGGKLGFLTGDSLGEEQQTAALQSVIAPLSPQDGAISTDGDVASFLTPTGVYTSTVSDPDPVLVDDRPKLTSLSLDAQGYTWSAGSADGTIKVSNVDKRQHSSLDEEGVGGTGFRAIAVSRDGARLAVLENTASGVRVAVMAVERDSITQLPTGLGKPLRIQPKGVAPVDMTWVDETSLAVLVQGSEGTSEVHTHIVGGDSTAIGAVQNGRKITGSNTPAGLRVLDKDSVIFVPRGNRWQSSDSVVTFILTQV